MAEHASLYRTFAALKPMVVGSGFGPFAATFLFVAVLEVAAVGLLPAFIAMLNEPRALLARAGLADAAALGDASDEQLILAFGALLAGFFLLKNLLIAAIAYFQAQFIADRQARLSTRMLSAYMRRPYTFHLQRNSAELITITTGMTFGVFGSVVVPGCIAATESLVFILVTGLLLAVSPRATLLAIGIVAAAALAFYLPFRARLRRLGVRQQADRGEMFKWVTQALGGIREAIMFGREQFFVDSYARRVAAYSRSDGALQAISTLPRLIVETLVICGLVLVVGALVVSGTSMASVFPTLVLFGVAVLRLMPSVMRIVGALTLINFHQSTVDTVCRDLAEPGDQPGRPAGTHRLALYEQIEARSLTYAYPGGRAPALRDVSVRIAKGSMVAFVGRSGAGKSTLVDILIGLHQPTQGTVLVDGRDTAADVGAWQRNIGYVPQSIFLMDDSLRRNVAFGLEDAEIDDARVLRALEAAQLGDFVKALPMGLDTTVGERGSRLSGGQRQRIGIARALYRDPDVLVLDEPTNALDRQTAEDFTAVLASLAGRKTVLLIAHQMSSVQRCDTVFLLRDGALVAEGAYRELAASHPEFQSLLE